MPFSRSRDSAWRPPVARRASQPKRDPGAYIGRLPERVPEVVPNGAAPDGQGEPVIRRDDARREAGESR